jgi:hypothetical protein
LHHLAEVLREKPGVVVRFGVAELVVAAQGVELVLHDALGDAAYRGKRLRVERGRFDEHGRRRRIGGVRRARKEASDDDGVGLSHVVELDAVMVGLLRELAGFA